MDNYNILEELKKAKNYEVALFTTYTFDIDYFERAIVGALVQRSIRKISVYVDAKQLRKSIETNRDNQMGRHYVVTPYETYATFHPKLILLVGENRAKLFVSSANLTVSGYERNTEVFNCFEYDANSKENYPLINCALSLFEEIDKESYGLDSELINYAKTLLPKTIAITQERKWLIHNDKETILNQVVSHIENDVDRIEIAVPYYDNELLAVEAIKEAFPKAKIHAYIQNALSTFPIECNSNRKAVDSVTGIKGFPDNGNSFYHGKVFAFYTNANAYILYGSANCTKSALTQSHVKGGNMECAVLEKGAKKEYKYFFDAMSEIDNDIPLTSQRLLVNENSEETVFFKYGVLSDQLLLYLGIYGNADIKSIYYQDAELSYIEKNGMIEVFVPNTIVEQIPNIFDITINVNGADVTLSCWYYSPADVENWRNRESSNTLDVIDIDSEGDKYIKERMAIIEAEAMSKRDIERRIAVYCAVKEVDSANEEKEDESGYVVDYEIPDDYRMQYRTYEKLAGIRRRILRSLYDKLIRLPYEKKDSDGTKENHNEVTCTRRATTAEIRFERFVKRRVRTLLRKECVDLIETEHYLGIMAVLFEVFAKYTLCVEDIFDCDYVIFTEINLLNALLSKDIKKLSKENEKLVIVSSLIAVVNSYIRADIVDDPDYKYKLEGKQLLTRLNQIYGIRESNLEYYPSVNNGCYEDVSEEKYSDIIEELFGAKSITSFIDFVNNRTGANTEITQSEKDMIITIVDDVLKSPLIVDNGIAREAAKLYRSGAGFNKLFIVNKCKNISFCIDFTCNQLRAGRTTDIHKLIMSPAKFYSV